ncbi:AAA family ATPase [Chryseobacterium hagamense]|uniref:DNA recombination protein RecF n=1 Tax=Chryseobacterium hagamense TaxID=395935 RepID=A0A511YMF9_9FLAO|nr:AAA family ATPase [Chryseobacterium hagamense]GEN76375.1 DNA recombination protein RecF [Chryseobacterium hagamense]
MKLLDLHLKNIGPFLDDRIEFATFENSRKQVTILTGENGTGKTIVLDAIRKVILADNDLYGNIKRQINRNPDFKIDLTLEVNNEILDLESSQLVDNGVQVLFKGNPYRIISHAFLDDKDSDNQLWIMNYWTSQNDDKPFHISSLDFIKPEEYLVGALKGFQKNAETTKIITFFDYYKSSDQPDQKKEGEFIYETIRRIFRLSLNHGELKYVDRTSLLPIIDINGNEISLEKLSSGNLYLIQRMLGLLSQMYSVYKLNNLPLEDLLKTPGVLLIDEAENHLHPKWQKTFLNSILDIFPNLQIIATTHSPFIVGSVDGAKVYVCKSEKEYSVISDETDEYSSKPIDEILISDAFDGTLPFANEKISSLLSRRKKAIKEKNKELENEIEDELKKINPQYFSYLELDNLLKSIVK